jgi:long-chain acyl-CoA synthetase
VPPEPAPCVNDGIIGCTQAVTLWELFCERVRRSRDRVAYRDYDPISRTWREHTWGAIAERVDRLRSALARAGLIRGDRVGLLLPNGIDWVCVDLAALGSGLVVVGLYPSDSSANTAYILSHSGCRLLLLDTLARWQTIAHHRPEFPNLEHVWFRNDVPPNYTARPVESRLRDVMAHASPAPATSDPEPGSLATLIYTSGTTARPKGVMLSHFAILWNAEATVSVIPPRPSDVFLSILPLAHAFERTLGYYLPMMGGSTVAYARSARSLAEDLILNRPTCCSGSHASMSAFSG